MMGHAFWLTSDKRLTRHREKNVKKINERTRRKKKQEKTLHTQRSQRVTIKAGDEANIGHVFSSSPEEEENPPYELLFCFCVCVFFFSWVLYTHPWPPHTTCHSPPASMFTYNDAPLSDILRVHRNKFYPNNLKIFRTKLMIRDAYAVNTWDLFILITKIYVLPTALCQYWDIPNRLSRQKRSIKSMNGFRLKLYITEQNKSFPRSSFPNCSRSNVRAIVSLPILKECIQV